MKKLYFILILLISTSIIFGQNIQIKEDRIKFDVEDVIIIDEVLKEFQSKSVIENHLNSNIVGYSFHLKNKKIAPTKIHGVIESLHYSYAEHRPFTLSPDIIWLMICQAITNHININSDQLKSQIVKFNNQKEIRVQANYLVKNNQDNDWHLLINTFTDSINNYVDRDLFTFYNQQFSTTSENESLSFQISLLNTVDNYFDFIAITECGIPYIELIGTKQDWMKIENQLDNLKELGLEKWISELKPILHQFIQASQGNIDQNFWSEIYKLREDCSDIYVTGWIMKFFPYKLNGSNVLMPNKNVFEENLFCDIQFDRIPNGLSKMNFKWVNNPLKLEQTEVYAMELGAGFIGISQDSISKMLKPEIVWFVKERDSLKINNIDSLITYQTAIEKLRLEENQLLYHHQIFTVVENYPIFNPEYNSTTQDGKEAAKDYLIKEIKKLNYDKTLHGKVYAQFIVSTSGDLTHIKIVKTDIPELNDNIIEILKNMPKWQPGKQRGKPVRVRYTLPIEIISL